MASNASHQHPAGGTNSNRASPRSHIRTAPKRWCVGAGERRGRGDVGLLGNLFFVIATQNRSSSAARIHCRRRKWTASRSSFTSGYVAPEQEVALILPAAGRDNHTTTRSAIRLVRFRWRPDVTPRFKGRRVRQVLASAWTARAAYICGMHHHGPTTRKAVGVQTPWAVSAAPHRSRSR
jgi:hypothetical protein